MIQFTDDHEYVHYWHAKIATTPVMSRVDLRNMVGSEFWSRTCGQLVLTLVRSNKLTRRDASWLSSQVPADSFAMKQLRARQTLENRKLAWTTKFKRTLDPNTTWAVDQIITTVPAKDIGKAMGLLAESPISRGIRMQLYGRLDGRRKLQTAQITDGPKPESNSIVARNGAARANTKA